MIPSSISSKYFGSTKWHFVDFLNSLWYSFFLVVLLVVLLVLLLLILLFIISLVLFDNLLSIYEKIKDVNPIQNAESIGKQLKNKLNLPICTLSPEQSRFFKRHYNSDKHNMGVLVREIDVIRKIEGW